jgi:pimeloyl-ACP methyl ester carboxylesterase
MVGASYGGLVVQELARTSPRAVAGVVLVDALHPELDARIARVLGPRRTAERAHELVTDIGEPVTFADLLASDREVETAGAFPEVPLVVLSHGEPFASFDPTYPTAAVEALWQRLERALATLSPCSVFTEVPGAHHRIHTDRPDAVVAAIDATLAAVRRARPGQPCRRPSVRFG